MSNRITLFEGFTSVGVALCTVCLLSLWNQRRRWKRRNPKGLPTPPGPKGLPLLGSVFEMPMIKPWIVYNAWSKEHHSDFIYFKVLNKSFLVLNSLKTVQDLLVKRSDKYSDRPRLPMICEVMEYGWSIGFMSYNDEWREHRKALTKHFNHNAVQNYQDQQLREARSFLLRMLQPDASANLIPNIRLTFAALIMDVSYGIRISDAKDPYIQIAEEAMDGLNKAAVPGAFLVDVFPALKHVPRWFPGAGWKCQADIWKKTNDIFLVRPFEEVKARLSKGQADNSIASQLLLDLQVDEGEKRQLKEDVAQNITATAYLGGSDTVVCALESFFVAMCLHPEAQRRAQAELDQVFSVTNALPTFADRPKLPYVTAVVEECLRWQIVAPLGVPHVLTEDDEYEGYFIPKGTLVLGNSWSILHDPQAVSEPSKFKPERYIRDDKFDPDASLSTSLGSFGFGRRICPGQYFSKDALFSMVASTLSVYDIRPKLRKDRTGFSIPITDDVTSGFVSHPVPFECTLNVRSPEKEQLIYDSVNIDTAAIWSLKHARWEVLGLIVQFCCFAILLAAFQLRCIWFCRKVFGLRSIRWKIFAGMAFISALIKVTTVFLVTYATIDRNLEHLYDPIDAQPILIARILWGISIFLNLVISLSCSLHAQAFVAQVTRIAFVAKCWYVLASLSTACHIAMFVLFQFRGGLALAHLPLTLSLYEISRTALDILEDHIAAVVEEEETRTVVEITTVLSDDASEMFEMPRVHPFP
ncbi:hypothetical protein NP233_g5306 [Leucocoprinus birnbaumii]|uniref:Cytochrome P450 n=1 Tax=Leucocoprinus birnbaumii TaxID=56174 RepID=A0AAD5VZG9_9AGAR|nr:hypothetical protein NP233_g5306 [Leucocoprinus birnbaumii]